VRLSVTTRVLIPVLVAAALGCGRLKNAAGDGADAAAPGGDGAPVAFGCLIGSSPVATSTVCGPHPELCGDVCGAACVDLQTDPDNCGGCGVTCKRTAACNGGVCGAEPRQLVAPAPGCRSMRLVLDNGAITWADLGHGTIKRIPTAGGDATTLVSGLHLAAIHTSSDQPLFVNSDPVGAGIVERLGTVIWIEAPDDVTLDENGIPHGGAGTTIRCLDPDGTLRTLVPASLAPDASPVSSSPNVANPVEQPGMKPPITSIALSPDATTVYFGAGTRLYKVPITGAKSADDVQLVGVTSGPEHGFPTALAADERRLFFPASVDTWVEIFDLTKTCDGTSTEPGYSCPSIVFGSHPIPLLDTVIVQDGFLYWGKENNVWRADLSVADPSLDGHATASDTIATFSVTGFAVGPQHAYFGENEFVEKGSFASVSSAGPPIAQILARGQTWPSSLAVDGTNVYWTTTACDIAFIADSPQ
jgi:hypothetical protein